MKNIFKPIFRYSKTNRIKDKNIFDVQMKSQQRLQYYAYEPSFRLVKLLSDLFIFKFELLLEFAIIFQKKTMIHKSKCLL
jgi:hypothetical protein